MTTELDIDLDMSLGGEHTAPLDADAIPNENQSHFCLSCEEPLLDLYCGNCGQKNDDYRRSLWSLGKEAIMSLTALENRIWRTWAALFIKPGKVAREFADGRRMHWSSPIRVYIFMSILLFGFMEITGTYFFGIEASPVPIDGVNKPAAELTVDDVEIDWQPHFFPTEKQVSEWNADVDFALLRRKLLARNESRLGILQDVISDTGDDGAPSPRAALEALARFEDASEDLSIDERRESIAALTLVRDNLETGAVGPAALGMGVAIKEIDLVIARERALLETQIAESELDATTQDTSQTIEFGVSDNEGGLILNGEKIDASATNRLLIDFLRRPEIGNNILNKWLPRIIFLMMPLTMLFGALYIRGRGRKRWFGRHKGKRTGHEALLYDHLVHAAYIHAVTYMLLFIGILASRVVSGAVVAQVLYVALMIYLPLSLRRMFNRGWFKTLWASYGVAFLYLMTVSGMTIWAVAVGLQSEIQEREAIMALEAS